MNCLNDAVEFAREHGENRGHMLDRWLVTEENRRSVSYCNLCQAKFVVTYNHNHTYDVQQPGGLCGHPEAVRKPLPSLEEQARKLALDYHRLLMRLREARKCLSPQYKCYFREYSYDFGAKRLNGEEGYSLRWEVREFPRADASYDNQQTSVGVVHLYWNETRL